MSVTSCWICAPLDGLIAGDACLLASVSPECSSCKKFNNAQSTCSALQKAHCLLGLSSDTPRACPNCAGRQRAHAGGSPDTSVTPPSSKLIWVYQPIAGYSFTTLFSSSQARNKSAHAVPACNHDGSRLQSCAQPQGAPTCQVPFGSNSLVSRPQRWLFQRTSVEKTQRIDSLCRDEVASSRGHACGSLLPVQGGASPTASADVACHKSARMSMLRRYDM